MPDFIGIIATQAYTAKQHEAQCEAIREICKEGNIQLFSREEGIEAIDTPPTQVWGCWNFSRGGGGEWIGSYCSTRDIVNYYNLAREICLKYNKPPQFYSRIMFGGHYCVARTNINFNKNDPDDIERARNLLKEIHEEVQQIDGAIMYKSPKWAYQTHKEKIFPATGELIEKIRQLLDPNKIMNPGQGRGED